MTASLEDLRADARFRQTPGLDRGADRMLECGGRQYLNLASNNYLGLAGHPQVKRAAMEAVELYGASSGASRLITGTYSLYDRLETELAGFKGCEDALVLGSGYAANLAIVSALADRHAVVFSDRLNHASIVDGIRLSGARQVRYRHNDMDHLRACLEQYREAERKLLVTDTVFSMDGDVADLGAIIELCREHDVAVVVDEAHGAGIFGGGRGLAHELGLTKEIDVHMGTLGKALGAHGAYVTGDRTLTDWLRNTARPFIFSTALPPAAVGAALAAVQLIGESPDMGRTVLDMAERLRSHCRAAGLDTGESATQIVPVILGSNERALRGQEILRERGVWAGAVRPPTVPKGSARLRLCLRADLTDQDMILLESALESLAEELA
nr:8-amino-7-oxononanoate synthase [Salidesulfovibrio onnuriiensis]